MTRLICGCTWWGLASYGLDEMLKKISRSGYDAVEIGIPNSAREQHLLRSLRDKYNLDLIVHQYSASGNNFYEYCNSLQKSLELAASFQPLLINSHTGKDYWSFEEGCHVFELAEEISQKYSVTIAHETHRGRLLYSAPVARQFFLNLDFLKINADFSHWVNVSESLLEEQENTMLMAISRAEHIHARIGYSQGPQVNDPRSGEWEDEMEAFSGWWKKIMKRHIDEQRPYTTVTPEFGPIPYTVSMPFTHTPLSDPWELNLYMKDYIKQLFQEVLNAL